MDSSAGAARAVPRLVVAIFTVSLNLLQRYYNLVDLLKLVMGLMFYIGPTVGPSARDSFPLVTCGFLQKRTKGRPSGRLHSDAQVSQQETPKTVHLRIGAPRMAL